MGRVAELKERSAELHAKATALDNLAKEKKRELTAEEQANFDGYLAESKEIRDKKLPDAQWLEDEEKRLAATDAPRGLTPTGNAGADGGGSFPAPRIVVPASGRFYENRLRAFRGEEAVDNAYIAGQFYAAALFKSAKAHKWCDKHEIPIRAALSEDSHEEGGALVPMEIEKAIIDLAEEYGTARQKCENVPMGSDTKIWPRVTGGLTVYFVGDNESITASDPAFDNIQLVARKAATLTKMSSEVDEDSMVALGDLITKKIALAFATKEDQCCFLGDGKSTYGGISGLITECTTATATIVTALTANTAFATLDMVDFESMIGKLPEYPGIQPEWYISKVGWAASMMRLADAAGGTTAEMIEGKRRLVFAGYPVNLVQCMNTTLTAQTSAKGICYLGDLAMAVAFGDRRGVTVAASKDRYFENDQIAIRGTERFDIKVHDVGDTTNPGAIIMLAMPSS